jgi:hypothetical protein
MATTPKYSQEQFSKYVDMSMDGKDHSKDSGFSEFMAYINDPETQNAITSGMAGQTFNIDGLARPALKFGEKISGWDSYSDNSKHGEYNYQNVSQNEVQGAPQNLIDYAKANPGKVVGVGYGMAPNQGDWVNSTGYVWRDDGLHYSQEVKNVGGGLAMAAPFMLNMFAPGLGTTIGSALGASATLAPIVGGAIIGGGTAALTGGNVLTGALMGGLGGTGSVNIPGLNFSVGDVFKGFKAADAISKGNILGAFSSIASMSGVGGIKVGDTGFTINELAKDANLLNAVVKGNYPALMSTIVAINNASSNAPAGKSNTPLDEQALSELTPEERAAYDAGGMAGLRAYAAQQVAPPDDDQPPVGNLPVVSIIAPPPPDEPPIDLSNIPSPVTPSPVTPPPLATVNINAPKCEEGYHYDESVQACVPDESALPPVISNPIVTPPPVTPPLVATVNINAPKCDPGFHYDEDAKACVPDEAALPPVTPPVTSTVTPPVVPPELVMTGPREPCPAGTHYDEELDACVPDDIVTPPVTAATTPAATPPAATTPTVTTPTRPTTTSSSKSGSSYADTKLSSFDKYLAGIYSPQKLVSLASLHQLFDSLTPDMKSFLTARNIAPPPMPDSEQTSKEDSSMNEKNFQTTFVASGGSIASDMAKMINEMSPKYERYATMLAAAPVTQHESRLGALKHMRQGPLKGAGLSGGLAHGGLPHKYAKAAPEGHNPEFITGITGYYAQGGGTGQSDDIPAMLHDGDFVMDADTVASLGDGSSKAGAEVLEKMRTSLPHQHSQSAGHPVPAKIADGEYVFPASFVTAIGGGSNKIGAQRLNEMREKIRAHKRSAPDSKIPPKAKSPLDYLKMAKG